MLKQIASMIALGSMMLAGGAAKAEDKIACDPATKKFEWHVCVTAPVEYKRGMKTESRDECTNDKIIKVPDGCNFGDLRKFVPEGADPQKTHFYAIVPIAFPDLLHESQGEPNFGECMISSDQKLAGWELMKFSDAFDKSNSERATMYKEALKKKGKKLLQYGLFIHHGLANCKDKKATRGVLDKKTLKSYLIYANASFTE